MMKLAWIGMVIWDIVRHLTRSRNLLLTPVSGPQSRFERRPCPTFMGSSTGESHRQRLGSAGKIEAPLSRRRVRSSERAGSHTEVMGNPIKAGKLARLMGKLQIIQ